MGRLPTSGTERAEVVRVYTRRAADWTKRFPRVVDAVRRLKAHSDGEGIVYDGAGMPSFESFCTRGSTTRPSRS
jgi:ATP-dependent DNA ligase